MISKRASERADDRLHGGRNKKDFDERRPPVSRYRAEKKKKKKQARKRDALRRRHRRRRQGFGDSTTCARP